MKKLILTLIVLTSVALAANASDKNWLTDLPKAQEQAKKESKLILLDFTGSDWCGWCIKFHEEVLSKHAFLEFAKKSLVLVEVDFPHEKQLKSAQKKANEALKSQYNVNGFPCLLLVDAEGKELWRQAGYAEGGPKAFIAQLEKFTKK